MSAGVFIITVYEADDGKIFPIKTQPETLLLSITTDSGTVTNGAPDGSAGSGLPTARVGGSRREYGVFARGVRIKFVGDPPANYKPDSPIFLPILKKGDLAKITRSNTGTYLTKPIKVLGIVKEKIN